MPFYIHPSIFYTRLIQLRVAEWEWSLSQLSLGERRVTPWTGHQFITGPQRDKRDKQPSTLTLTPRFSLESPVNLTIKFLGGGRNQEPCCCEATVLTTTTQCSAGILCAPETDHLKLLCESKLCLKCFENQLILCSTHVNRFSNCAVGAESVGWLQSAGVAKYFMTSILWTVVEIRFWIYFYHERTHMRCAILTCWRQKLVVWDK